MDRILIAVAVCGCMPAAASAQTQAPPKAPPLVRIAHSAWRDGGHWTRDAVQWVGEREVYARLINVMTGEGPSWFRPSQTRHDWKWLAGRFDADRDAVISRAEFTGPATWFDSFDKDRSGVITAADLDWSKTSFFQGKGKGERKAAKSSAGYEFSWTKFKAFFDGDVGSWCEGPALNARAPDFTLPTPDSKKTMTLSDFAGRKPVVLVFGSFT
jgi:hypothetical protein